MVFVGTFEAKGAKLETGDGTLKIEANGAVTKLVKEVEQITFSGTQAIAQNQFLSQSLQRTIQLEIRNTMPSY